MSTLDGKLRLKFVWPYAPPVRRRFYTKYHNGITLWIGNMALHVWRHRATVMRNPCNFPACACLPGLQCPSVVGSTGRFITTPDSIAK